MQVKQAIIIRTDLKMRRGKEVSQGGHAACAWLIDLWRRGDLDAMPDVARAWLDGDQTKVCLRASSEQELLDLHRRALEAGLPSHLVWDLGKTEFHGVRTLTALAIGPDLADRVDAITGHLKLY